MKKSILAMKSLVLVGALFLVGCNTDDGIQCPEALTGELTAVETEFSGTWIFTAMEAEEAIDLTEDNTDNPSKDIFAQYGECERDLVYELMGNRNYEIKQGYTAFDCNNKQSLTGTWSLTGNNLAFVANCSSQNITIEKNAEGTMFSYVATVNFKDVKGTVKAYKVTFTYEKAVEVE